MTVEECLASCWPTVLVLSVILILILSFRNSSLTITQNQNATPKDDEKEKSLVAEFFSTIIKLIKVSFEFTFKILFPGVVVLAVLYVFLHFTGIRIGILDRLKKCVDAVCSTDGQQADYTNGKAIYDTDPDMDTYIKGDLNAQQFGKLDKVLAWEKKQYGSRVSATDLQRLAASDPAVFDAYTRWLQCKSLNRSSFHVVYPDERKSHH